MIEMDNLSHRGEVARLISERSGEAERVRGNGRSRLLFHNPSPVLAQTTQTLGRPLPLGEVKCGTLYVSLWSQTTQTLGRPLPLGEVTSSSPMTHGGST